MAYLMIIGSSAAVYVFIIVALRIFGKEEIAQLSVIDLVFVLLISNAVQNAMVGSNTTLLGGLVAAATLFVLNYCFKWLLYKIPKLSNLVQGHELMLIYRGRIIDQNLRRAQISMDELLEAVREHGVASTKDVNLAVLELDGNISVLSNDYQHRTTQPKRHRNRKRTKDIS